MRQKGRSRSFSLFDFFTQSPRREGAFLPRTVLLFQVPQSIFTALDHDLIERYPFFARQFLQIFDQLVGHADGLIGGFPFDDLKHLVILSFLFEPRR